MDQTDAASFVTGRVRVERADVAAAKSFIAARFAELANRERDPRAGTVRAETLIQAWIGECDIDAPWSKALYRGWLERETHLDLTGPDAEAQLTTCARAISQAVAVQEALRELAASGLLIAIGPTVPWHEVAILAQSHGGRHRFGLTITDLSSAYPERVMVPWARRGKSLDPRLDADLYLHVVGSANLHAGIAAALREAVECFRRDLYLPCLAMLAAAADGLWVEAGRALIGAAGRRDKAVEKVDQLLGSERSGLAQRVEAVAELYSRRDLFQAIHDASGHRDLAGARQWTDILRDARNVLHWGVQSASDNSYAKVATLLEASALHVRALEAVRETAVAGQTAAHP